MSTLRACVPMMVLLMAIAGRICCRSLIISNGLDVIPSKKPVPAAANNRPGLIKFQKNIQSKLKV